jgi:cobalt-zinc-cadmium resistance protein CzcA
MAAAELCTPLHAWLHGGTITGTPFSVSSGIGFLALFGVSVQMAVVYISYVNELRLNGTNLTEAVREGAILRLRPIMMTALVAALGLLPAALATGVGTDTQRPFALVIVSGLFTRLLISIFLMPVLYTLVAFGRPAGSVMSHLHLAKNPRREVRC